MSEDKPIINKDFLKSNLRWVLGLIVFVVVLWLKSLFVTKVEAEAHNAELDIIKKEWIIYKVKVDRLVKDFDKITELKIKEE